jgi:SAM-dependent methyltransferase
MCDKNILYRPVDGTTSINTAALDRLKDVFRRDKAAVCAQFSEWFYTYHADLFVHGVPFDVYIRKMELIRRELQGVRMVLDVGAGFGVYASLLRILGVPRVVAMDYHAQKARDAARLVSHLGLDGIQILQGDALALPFRPGHFDGALTLACLSHIREPEDALRNLSVLLVPGGRVWVFEDNNSSYPGYDMTDVWEGAETGGYADAVPSEKQRAESYIEMRRDLIRRRHPDLPADKLQACAVGTRGLYGRKMFDAVDEYLKTGELKNPRRHLVCHPESGEYEEYPLNPALVKQMLRGAGFDPRLRSPHTGPFSGKFRLVKGAVAGIFRLCPPLLTWMSPTFSVLATKR